MATTSKLLHKEMIVVLMAILFMDTFLVSAQSPLVSFRARKHNDTIISSNFFLGDVATVNNVSPGDTIEIDMYLSGWGDVGDGTLRGWQIIPDCKSYIHVIDFGCYLKPLGWDAPLIRQDCDLVSQCSAVSKNAGSSCCNNNDCKGGVCEASPDCLDEDYPICNQCPVELGVKRCTGSNFDPSMGAFIKRKLCSIESDNAGDLCFMDDDCSSGTCIDNENFIFHGMLPQFNGVTVDHICDYIYGGLAFSSCIEDIGERRYAGTLILKAQAGARGTFRIVARVLQEGEPGSSTTFVESCDGLPVEASSSALTINMNSPFDCHVECTIVDSDPPNCSIDARYPWPSDDFANKLGWNSIDIRVAGECPTVMTTDDFAIRFEGGVGFPSITDVTDLGNQTYRVSFSPPLRPRLWACVVLLAGVVENPTDTVCIGAMPADVNADRISNADDVQAMIDHLNSPSLSIWQCDADRSGSCQPADVLGVIDMLNGADAFHGWHGDSLIACPSWP